MNIPTSPLTLLLRYTRPFSLLVGILMYALGTGVADYLGFPIDAGRYVLGQACVTLLQLSSYFLKGYYDLIGQSSPGSPLDEEERRVAALLPRGILQQVAMVTLAVGAGLTVLLYAGRGLNPSAIMVLAAAVFLGFFYAVPPLRLAATGYGELVDAVLLTALTPALAFLLQKNEMHRLLPLLTLPLVALYLAMRLALSLENYAHDTKYQRKTLMTQMGWQRSMIMHNLLIVTAYVLLALAKLVSLPWNLAWPALLPLPIAVFQIWQMNAIAAGGKTRWKLLQTTAIASVIMTAYLITFTLWTS